MAVSEFFDEGRRKIGAQDDIGCRRCVEDGTHGLAIPVFAEQPFGWGGQRMDASGRDVQADILDNLFSAPGAGAFYCSAKRDQRLLRQAPMRLFGAECQRLIEVVG